jgi:hypothetical protein
LLGLGVLPLRRGGVCGRALRLERDGPLEVHDGVVVAAKSEEVHLAEQELHRGVVGVALLGVHQLLERLPVFQVAPRSVVLGLGLLGLVQDGDGGLVVAAAGRDVFLVGAMGAGANEEKREARPASRQAHERRIAGSKNGPERAFVVARASTRCPMADPCVLAYDISMRVIPSLVALAALLIGAGSPLGCQCGLEPLAAEPGSLAGVACDPETGLPVDAGEVVVETQGERLSVRTDDGGHFFVSRIPAGDVNVRLPGERVVAVLIPPGETVDVDDTACRADADAAIGSVVGRVCNGHVGQVVAGADVLILLADGTRLQTVTDDEGRFAFAEVPAGGHAISVRGDGYSRSEALEVVAGEETAVDMGDACAIPAPAQLGGVSGRVCTADGARPLDDARASIAPAGLAELSTLTDADGRFLLEGVPAGAQVLVIQKGTFRSERAVTIPAGGVLALDEEDCALAPDDIRIAVVRGSQYDHVEQVLGSIGIDDVNIDLYDGDWAERLLGPDERVRDYDVVFLNCRSAEPVYLASSTMRTLMRSYVADGGSLFASDQAYDLIERTFSDKIDFVGTETTLSAADQGRAVDGLAATVVNAEMAGLLGRSTATLHYPLETWSMMQGVADDVDVYLIADPQTLDGRVVDDAPQIVGFDHGEGRVTYSSFHQEPGSHPDQLRILQLLMFEL